MSSSRPYFIRALYEWIVDNDCTPYLLVNARGQGVSVPQDFVNKDGQIILNVAPSAVRDLLLRNEAISFNARFGGIPTDIYIPCASVLGVYARENGQGMIFDPEPPQQPPPDDGGGEPDPGSPSAKKPSLRVVK